MLDVRRYKFSLTQRLLSRVIWKSFICHWWRAEPETFGFLKNFFGTSLPFVFYIFILISATQYCELLFIIYLCST